MIRANGASSFPQRPRLADLVQTTILDVSGSDLPREAPRGDRDPDSYEKFDYADLFRNRAPPISSP